jgi:serine/threonine protein kinase
MNLDTDLHHDRFNRQRTLSDGGAAEVYVATVSTDETTGSLVVREYSNLDGSLTPQTCEELALGMELWSVLDDCEHIVDVVDYGTEPDPWLAMEYVDGGHLGERVGTLSFDTALQTALAVADGLAYAHRRDVVHLNLKPSNILCHDHGATGYDIPKITDWDRLRRGEQTVASPYAAPEQFVDSATVDTKTDIYQLGALCYELFVGEPPGIEAVRTIHETVVPPTEVEPSLPDALDDILAPAIARNRHERYEKVRHFRAALGDLLYEYTR